MEFLKLFFIKRALRKQKLRVQAKPVDILTARKGFDRLTVKHNLPLAGFEYEAVDLNGLRAEWVRPPNSDRKKVLLYFHGGGYNVGSIDTHRSVVSHIAQCAGSHALHIDYRLAPENQYPAAIDDASTAFHHLLSLDFKPSQIAFGGDSAGGGVAVGTMLRLRDRGEPLPACAVLLSPWLDLTLSSESIRTLDSVEPMLIASAMPKWVSSYLGQSPANSPYASPVLHPLHDLPPCYVQVGSEEILLDDSINFSARAKEYGVDVKLEVFPRYFHTFNCFWPILKEAKRANKDLGMFISSHLKQP